MVFITLTLNYNQWERVRNMAMIYWPNEPLDRQLSRNEACRRLLLGGMHKLLSAPKSDQQQIAQEYSRPVQPPGDNRPLPMLPGAPK